MIQFTKPVNLNGAELVEELKAAGVQVSDFPTVDGSDILWLDIQSKDEAKASSVVEAHNGTIVAPELTVVEKLASVGLSVNDLKAALGL